MSNNIIHFFNKLNTEVNSASINNNIIRGRKNGGITYNCSLLEKKVYKIIFDYKILRGDKITFYCISKNTKHNIFITLDNKNPLIETQMPILNNNTDITIGLMFNGTANEYELSAYRAYIEEIKTSVFDRIFVINDIVTINMVSSYLHYFESMNYNLLYLLNMISKMDYNKVLILKKSQLQNKNLEGICEEGIKMFNNEPVIYNNKWEGSIRHEKNDEESNLDVLHTNRKTIKKIIKMNFDMLILTSNNCNKYFKNDLCCENISLIFGLNKLLNNNTINSVLKQTINTMIICVINTNENLNFCIKYNISYLYYNSKNNLFITNDVLKKMELYSPNRVFCVTSGIIICDNYFEQLMGNTEGIVIGISNCYFLTENGDNNKLHYIDTCNKTLIPYIYLVNYTRYNKNHGLVSLNNTQTNIYGSETLKRDSETNIGINLNNHCKTENNTETRELFDKPILINKMGEYNDIEYNRIEINKLNINSDIILKNLELKKIGDFNNIFNNINIYQICISDSLVHLDRIYNLYNLVKYTNIYLPCVFFGVYNLEDVKRIQSHKGDVYIMWGGTDINLNYESRKSLLEPILTNKKNSNIINHTYKHIAISTNIQTRLNNLDINSIYIHLDLMEREIFKPNKKETSNKIFIYNGISQNNEKLYGKEIYDEVISKLPEYEYIFSNKLNVKNTEMPKIYSECFIGLRLTENDGNANSVQEMLSMKIPVIHNGDYETIKWKNAKDVELAIRYENIRRFNETLDESEYKKILFISTDFPNYGGASTNTYKLINWYTNNTSKKIFGLFITKMDNRIYEDFEFENNILIDSDFTDDNKDIINNYFEGEPDLIIIRNFVDMKKVNSYYKSPKIFLIPGVFQPTLNVNINLENLDEHAIKQHIHPKIIDTIRQTSKSYTNSYLTYKILREYFNIETEILYFNYIPYYNEYTEIYNNEREYKLGVIVSNFNRNIKNIGLIKKMFEEFPDIKKIAIGNGSNYFGDIKNTTCLPLLSNNEVEHYLKQIDNVISSSYYESCSNLLIEAEFNGATVIIIDEKNYSNSIKKLQKKYNIVRELDLSNNYKDEDEYETIFIDIMKNETKREKIQHNKKEILILSTQYVNYGGAATLAYVLHEKLIESGKVNSKVIFLNSKKIDNKQINPKKLEGVISETLPKNMYMSDIEYKNYYKDLIDNLNKEKEYKPDIIIGLNYSAPIIGKKLYPKVKTYYYLTGSKNVSDKDITAQEYLQKEERKLNEQNTLESYCINLVDYIIPNSELTKNVIIKTYPEIKSKLTEVIMFEKIFFKDYNGNNEKKYDIAVISSRFDRNVKNIAFMAKLFESEQLKDLQKICIGINSEDTITHANKHFGFVSNETVSEIMRETKIVLICSKFESASITLIQAVSNGCIVISNINVGVSSVLDDLYIMNNYNIEEWNKRILNIINNYDYHKKIFKIRNKDLDINNEVEYLINYEKEKKKYNILFVSIDRPYDGGSSTNTLNMITTFKGDELINPIGLFIVPKKMDNEEEYVMNYNKQNIYFIDTIEESKIKEIINNIISKHNINLIFIKNYKAYIYIKWVVGNKIKIIFSPSGLRVLSELTTECVKTEFIKREITETFDENLKLNEFINKYDKIIEDYIYKDCKWIIPNSNLTFDILNKIYNLGQKILNPVPLTYIDFISNFDYSDFNNRKYDIGFACFSWNRKVKNFELVKQILADSRINNYKVLVIGHRQGKYKKSNIEQIDNIPHHEMINMLKQVKIMCFTSFYDSSPNVLKEALMANCKVLVSKNIGNHENLPITSIVNNLSNVNEWFTKIAKNLEIDTKINFTIFGDNVKNKLKYQIISILEEGEKIDINNSSFGIYKVPAKWNSININEINKSPKIIFKENIYDITNIVEGDIYYKMFINNAPLSKTYNYVIIDESLEDIEIYKQYKFYPYYSNKYNIWKIGKPEHLKEIIGAKFYFLRGNYYDIYSNFISNNKTILYPATSLVYNKNFELDINKKYSYKYNYVLCDDINNQAKWQDIFINSKVINYIKNTTTQYYFYNSKREYDYIYVATENQPTKNRELFVDFIYYCEKNRINIKILNIGKKTEEFNKINNLFYVDLISYDYVKKENIIDLYNNSKINLLFSGRDALPRVLTESLACGCFNIALDTISDGKYLYDGILGVILSFPEIKKQYNSNTKSISYISNDNIYKKILEYRNKDFNHKEISLKYKLLSNKSIF